MSDPKKVGASRSIVSTEPGESRSLTARHSFPTSVVMNWLSAASGPRAS